MNVFRSAYLTSVGLATALLLGAAPQARSLDLFDLQPEDSNGPEESLTLFDLVPDGPIQPVRPTQDGEAEAAVVEAPTPEDFSKSLILRLGERRVYLYDDDQLIADYPVAVGRAGWETPTGSFQIRETVSNPEWRSPFSGAVIGVGPQNPLGPRWIGFWTDGYNSIGFHGTPHPHLIGQAVSHGCVRMRNEDILALFEQVEVGMAVTVEP